MFCGSEYWIVFCCSGVQFCVRIKIWCLIGIGLEMIYFLMRLLVLCFDFFLMLVGDFVVGICV
jgi:hypothetical protein